jgi:hypothetical protein
MARHKSFTVVTNVDVYYCDPQSPWQRGSNENTNGLLRQYFPKKTDLSAYSQSDLDKVALRLNILFLSRARQSSQGHIDGWHVTRPGAEESVRKTVLRGTP